jgi:phosphogluconate dehydratase
MGGRAQARQTQNDRILRPVSDPFQPTRRFAPTGGQSGARGDQDLCRGPVAPYHHSACSRLSTTQKRQGRVQAGEFTSDTIVVVRFQGPASQWHAGIAFADPGAGGVAGSRPAVALVTDGRMSGASGKVPAAIHVAPEAAKGGPLARLRDGDLLRLDAVAGTLDVLEARFRQRTHAGHRRPERECNRHRARVVRHVPRDMWATATEGAGVVV